MSTGPYHGALFTKIHNNSAAIDTPSLISSNVAQLLR